MLFREGRAAEEEISLQPSEGGSTYSTSCTSLTCPSSHKALLCLAESTLNLERRKRNKYSKYWGSEETKVSYVGLLEKQNFLVKLFQFSVFLFWVFVFFKKGVSCAQRAFSERAATQGFGKRRLLEMKWNQKPRSQTPIKPQKFRSRSALQTAVEKGRIRSIA